MSKARCLLGMALMVVGAAVIAKVWGYSKCDDPAYLKVIIAPSVIDPMHPFGLAECSWRPSVVEKAVRITVPTVVLLVVGAAVAYFARRWRLILGGGAAALTIFISGLLGPDPIYYIEVTAVLAAIGFVLGLMGAWLGSLAFRRRNVTSLVK